MYASHGFLQSDIGDVDVLYHDGQFHLFHLILPNHDFIAHAVSEDGLSWRRVKNALFVGEPGTWDDDMLWTMHVSPDPERPGAWRMFYTGLSRLEFGRVQRVGLARSDDLMRWERVNEDGYPLEICNHHYESDANEGRKWVSFRDPFLYADPETGERVLLASARVNRGPLVRRGCVALARETEPDRFTFEEPLHHPGLYDDIEVPNLFKLDGRHYLLGSIREDTKVHYWHADRLEGPYGNFFDNVLLPRGNYAARICRRGDDVLLFNFFARQQVHLGREVTTRILPPPKRLVTDGTGRLRMRSFGGFDDLVRDRLPAPRAGDLGVLFKAPHAHAAQAGDALELTCPSGYEAFLLPGEHESMRLRGSLELEGSGKCGLVLRVDEEGNGYYLSLDLIKGILQLRAWGENPTAELDCAFHYHQLQAGYFISDHRGPWDIEVIAHGMYLEVSVNGYVTLSLVDDAYAEGRFGFYTESACLRVRDVSIERLRSPSQEQPGDPVYTSVAAQSLPDVQTDSISDS